MMRRIWSEIINYDGESPARVEDDVRDQNMEKSNDLRSILDSDSDVE